MDALQALEDVMAHIESDDHEIIKPMNIIRAALTAQEWKPISEEPDELQEIVVCWPDGEWLKALYYDGEYCFEVNEGKAMVQKIGFTHWRPIQPPKKD